MSATLKTNSMAGPVLPQGNPGTTVKAFKSKVNDLIVEALRYEGEDEQKQNTARDKLLKHAVKHKIPYKKLSERVSYLDKAVYGESAKSDSLNAHIEKNKGRYLAKNILSKIGIVAGIIGSLALTVIGIGSLVTVVALPAGIIFTPIGIGGSFFFFYKLYSSRARSYQIEKTETEYARNENDLIEEAIANKAKVILN